MWDEEKVSSLRHQLLEARIIDLTDEINAEMAMYVRVALAMLQTEGSPDIEVHITSNGGLTGVSFDLVDLFRHYPGKVTGKVFGFARSAAATILQGCDVRLASPHACILVHHSTGRVSFDELEDPEKLKKLRENRREETERMYGIYLSRTGDKLNRDKLAQFCQEEREMYASEALEFGLIDDIIKDKELEE